MTRSVGNTCIAKCTCPEPPGSFRMICRRACKREAFWISVIAHIVLAIIVVNSPRFDRLFPQRQVVFKPTDQKDLHFLELPPDSQHVTKKPDTNIISDKDRIASSKTPQLDHKKLKRLWTAHALERRA